jgi:hypothetical protein
LQDKFEQSILAHHWLFGAWHSCRKTTRSYHYWIIYLKSPR